MIVSAGSSNVADRGCLGRPSNGRGALASLRRNLGPHGWLAIAEPATPSAAEPLEVMTSQLHRPPLRGLPGAVPPRGPIRTSRAGGARARVPRHRPTEVVGQVRNSANPHGDLLELLVLPLELVADGLGETELRRA